MAAGLAACLPALLAYNAAPSPTFLNQALAFALWALFVLVSAPSASVRGSTPVLAVFGVLSLAASVSWGLGGWPSSLALSTLGTLGAGALMLVAGTGTRARGDIRAVEVFVAFCWGWLLAGALNVGVALLQVFLPAVFSSELVAISGLPGRAVGNLRQPNHLSSMLVWSCIAVVGLLELRRLRLAWAWATFAALVFSVVLTASRTGSGSVLVLAAWGLLDRRLSRTTRALLLAAPLIYGLSWLGLAEWAQLSSHTFGGAKRLEESALGGSRLAILVDTLALIRQQPWWGVGWGEFNFAWSLTPFPHRPSPFFDHSHNLPLQLAVELGLPLAMAVMALLVWALWCAARSAWRAEAAEVGLAQRCCVMLVCMIGLHSQVEYPLWYSYFLLPAAWAFGFALGDSPAGGRLARKPASAEPRSLRMTFGAMLLLVGTLVSALDYLRVSRIFQSAPDSAPLEVRIRDGQRSIFFAHHADYAAVTSGFSAGDSTHGFDRVTHYLLDTRLMIAWSRALAEQGDLDAARHVAARLREFKKEDAADFFAPCAAPLAPGVAPPFQCIPPSRAMDWREFIAR